jgi:hypothetical protein
VILVDAFLLGEQIAQLAGQSKQIPPAAGDDVARRRLRSR